MSFVRLRHMEPADLVRFNNINLDEWTEMYTNSFYLEYMVKHKVICFVAQTLDGALAGYILAKMEGAGFKNCSVLEDDAANVRRLEEYTGNIQRSGRPGRSPLTIRDWHSHISALSVAPEYRRAGVASLLLDKFEAVSEAHNCWFADLFVRCSNTLAISVYKKRGYYVYRRIKGYYSGQEDAFDMRRPLHRDFLSLSIQNAGYSVSTEDLYKEQGEVDHDV